MSQTSIVKLAERASQNDNKLRCFSFSYGRDCPMPSEKSIRRFFSRYGEIEKIIINEAEERGKVYFSKFNEITIIPSSHRVAGLIKRDMTEDNHFFVKVVIKKKAPTYGHGRTGGYGGQNNVGNFGQGKHNFNNFNKRRIYTRNVSRGKADDDIEQDNNNAFLRANREEKGKQREEVEIKEEKREDKREEKRQNKFDDLDSDTLMGSGSKSTVNSMSAKTLTAGTPDVSLNLNGLKLDDWD